MGQKVLPAVIKIVGIAIIVALGISWIALLMGMIFGSPFLDFIVPDKALFSYLGAFNLFMIIGIPLFSVVLLIMRLFFRTRLTKAWRTALGIFWGINLVGFGISTAMVGKEFEYGAEITKVQTTLDITTDTLELTLFSKEYDSFLGFDDGSLRVVDDKLIFENLSVSIKRAEGPNFEFIQVNEARGSSPEQADYMANTIRFEYTLNGSHLILPTDIEVTKEEKWRVQGVEVTLLIPEGKFIKLDQDLNGFQGRIQRKDPDNRIWKSRGNIWVMEDEGLMCVDCE